MKNFENLHFVKQKMTTIRRITGIISLIVFSAICIGPSYEFGQSEIYQKISQLVVFVNAPLYFLSWWVEDKLKNVY